MADADSVGSVRMCWAPMHNSECLQLPATSICCTLPVRTVLAGCLQQQSQNFNPQQRNLFTIYPNVKTEPSATSAALLALVPDRIRGCSIC